MDTIIKTTLVQGRAGGFFRVRTGSMDLGNGDQFFTDVFPSDSQGRAGGMYALQEREFPNAEEALAGHDALLAVYAARGQWRFR
jgi:hypothetical protein